VSLVNDGARAVTIQPCGRFFCHQYSVTRLAVGESHT
jgi:hypothetical protein